MSAPSKKKKTGGKKEREPIERRIMKPAVAPPSALVQVKHDGVMMERRAAGYSLGEAAQAGLDVKLARRWGLRVDDRRRSVLGGNVSSLKKWAAQSKKTTEGKVEGEVRKIEKAVEKEVHKAEKEVKKVEREVVRKVEAPIKKRSKKKEETKRKSS